MSSASVVVVLPPAFDASIAAMSSKPPSRLAMSPDGSGSPSSAVTMPTMSMRTVGRDHDDLQLLGREPERLRA